MMYPLDFEKLINMFQKLPGVGAKTAQRFAFAMLDFSEEERNETRQAIEGIAAIHRCEVCGFLCSEERCEICKDQSRDQSTIVVVAYPQEVAAIEKAGFYHGLYHVLGGLISSNKGIFPDDLLIGRLLERIDENTKEVILATSSTMDGEMTALYLDKVLKNRKVLVTRLAHGLPMGASLDYADELTLIKALNNRRRIEE